MSSRENKDEKLALDRRKFIATTSAVAVGAALSGAVSTTLGSSNFAATATTRLPNTDTLKFSGPDSLFYGHEWQSLNPGFWKIENGSLRRRVSNFGDRARSTGFPFHAATHGWKFETEYDPSLLPGLVYWSQWKLKNKFSVSAKFTYRAARPEPKDGDDAKWKMYRDGFGQMGIAIGAKNLQESYTQVINVLQVVWSDDQQLKLVVPNSKNKNGKPQAELSDSVATVNLEPGAECNLLVSVEPINENKSKLVGTLTFNEKEFSIEQEVPNTLVEGYCGVTSQGLIDFEVNQFHVEPFDNKPLDIGITDCFACYPLGDSLKQVGDQWVVKFVGLFASDGDNVEIRVSDSESPQGGWENVPVAGKAQIVNNKWRRNTAIVNTTLPVNPGEKTLYYTVWKDGVDVTGDNRIGTDACGPGSGFVGDVPSQGTYVGRLPQLVAPYKLCGLSCHAINKGLQHRDGDGWKMTGHKDDWIIRDQPTKEAYKHLEEYDFQVMVWEDDVWYMELVMYPPSTDDAYKIVTHSICGPTSRWQLMRHWNVINPGDHDYGMDDVKGPEQLAIRNVEGLGQDCDYMRRNFQIVHHLTTGAEEVDPLINPKKWRAWKMPNRDFTFIVCDSRLWRSSQDVDIWDDAGWGKFKSLYDRTDPTRSLLGEEQFGWLQEQLATDSSPLICLTGISGMHTIWAGAKFGKTQPSKDHPMHFEQRDRVTADYAGWVKAGADRVLELLGSRQGIATVYGDVHNGCVMTNKHHRIIECSFGPIGRSGGRGLIPGFGPEMKDVDGRELNIHALYHAKFSDPSQTGHGENDPFYWNFLEMEFDPAHQDPKIGMRIRNLIDPPTETPRGGNALETTASQTGRIAQSQLGAFSTLANADVRFSDVQGKPICATRSNSDGVVAVQMMVDVPVETKIVMTAFDGTKSDSRVFATVKI